MQLRHFEYIAGFSFLRTFYATHQLLLDFSLNVKAAPHECVIRTSQP